MRVSRTFDAAGRTEEQGQEEELVQNARGAVLDEMKDEPPPYSLHIDQMLGIFLDLLYIAANTAFVNHA